MRVIIETEELSNVLTSINSQQWFDGIKLYIKEGYEVIIRDYNGVVLKSFKTEQEFEDFVKHL